VEEEGQALLTVKGDEGGNGDQSMGTREGLLREYVISMMKLLNVDAI
jgi:hypothetical protein